ncbi:hypothetical protein FQ027_25090, partial [Escherichia coli]|nr:hypothetical protein [Escherichia coli]
MLHILHPGVRTATATATAVRHLATLFFIFNYHLSLGKNKTKRCPYHWICPYISRHLLSLNPLQARCRRYSR